MGRLKRKSWEGFCDALRDLAIQDVEKAQGISKDLQQYIAHILLVSDEMYVPYFEDKVEDEEDLLELVELWVVQKREEIEAYCTDSWNFAPEFAPDVRSFNPEWLDIEDLDLSGVKAMFIPV